MDDTTCQELEFTQLGFDDLSEAAATSGAPTAPELGTYDIILVNTSAGKDSQAMLTYVHGLAEAAGVTDRIVAVHADLGRVEWPGTAELAEEQAAHYDARFLKVTRPQGDLLTHIEQRGMFPSSTTRYCTSDHKRGQIRKVMTMLADEHRARGGSRIRILNCMGFRRQESPARAKKIQFVVEGPASNGRRQVDEWLPILEWDLDQVWSTIHQSGVRYHPAYDAGMPRLSCCFCLAGETEVVTRRGLAPIGSLAGSTHDLLIPKVTPFGISGDGTFKPVEVRSFGVQELMRVTLTRYRQEKVVYATPEHRWMIEDRKLRPPKAGGRHNGYERTTVVSTTEDLVEGAKLRPVRAVQPSRTKLVPFAAAQGFVFGDGARAAGDRPGSLTIHDPEKAYAMLPLFAAHDVQTITANDAPALRVYGLPRTWKGTPPVDESRPFLLSWLAGYFAADGCVTKDGSPRLDSAVRANLEFARSVAAICGVGYGPIRRTMRVGKSAGGKATPLYHLPLDATTVPEWFFMREPHHQRVVDHASTRERAERLWSVKSVERTSRVEEVFCAVVPGAKAFALSDGLMTGNCVLASRPALVRAAQLAPELAAEYAAVEVRIGHRFTEKTSMADIIEAARHEEPVEVPDWAA